MTRLLPREISEPRPVATVCQETPFLSILKTADIIHRRYSEVMEPFGITFQQYNVLKIVRSAGTDGIPTTDIADGMIESSPGLTRLIDCLETKNLVRRVRSSEDRRVVTCHVTEAGATLLKKTEGSVKKAEQSIMKTMTSEHLATLKTLLAEVRESFGGGQ
jgi:MarR family transcriptional regulator, organic hydroperoxide resistance regulator